MTTTPEQRTRLKAAAEAATPGPWDFRTLENFGGNVVRYRNGDRFDIARIAKAGLEANAAFIALANPSTILALLAEIEALEARVASADGALQPFADFASLPGFDKLPEKVHVTNGSSLAARQITVGDLRAARAHFQSQGGDHGRD